MAFIANTAFEARITNNEFDELCNITGKVFYDDDPIDCSAGVLCCRDSLLPCEGFTGINNENAWEMYTADSSATAFDVIYACNTYDWPLITDPRGNTYAVGHAVLGLGVPAGRYGTFTKIVFDGQHRYRFGVGNLSSALTTEPYLTIDSGGLLAPAATEPANNGDIYFEIVGTGNFTEGTSGSFGYVDVIGRQTIA